MTTAKTENAPPESWAIETCNITKSFGTRYALRGVDLKARKGEFLALFGSNGAGKTTLIKILATILKPTSGNLRIAGLDQKDKAKDIRRNIGVVSHQTYLYDNFTAHENLKFYGRMYNVPDLQGRIHDVFAEVGLPKSRLHDRVGTYSRGMQQRLAIARAVLHRPTILLLDEPETGLDQQAGDMLREMVDTFREGGRTTVMATHSLERGLEMGDHVMILDKGRIAYEERTQGLSLNSLQETYYHYTGWGH